MPQQVTLGNPRKKRATRKKAGRKTSSKKKTATRLASSKTTSRRSKANPRKKRRVSKARKAAIEYGASVKEAMPKVVSATAIVAATVGTISLGAGVIAMQQKAASANVKMLTQVGIGGVSALGAVLLAPKTPMIATGLGLSAALFLGRLLFSKVKIDGQSPVENALQARADASAGNAAGSGTTGNVIIRSRDGRMVHAKRAKALSGNSRTFGETVSEGVNGLKQTFGEMVTSGMNGTQITYGERLYA